MNDAVPPPVFRHRVRVYWQDTDAGGVVFYANYLKFFEQARTEWMRASGFGQAQLRDEFGAIFVVGEVSIRYVRPARLDDDIDLTVVVRHEDTRSAAKLTFRQQAWRGEELLAEGSVLTVCVNAETFRPQRIPSVILERLPLSPSLPT